MSEPRRFRERDGMLGAAFRAADEDQPPAHAKNALLVALGASTVVGTTKVTALSAAFARATGLFAKASLATKVTLATAVLATGTTVAATRETPAEAPARTLAAPHHIASTTFRTVWAVRADSSAGSKSDSGSEAGVGAQAGLGPKSASASGAATPPPAAALATSRPAAAVPAAPRVHEEIAELEAARVAIALGRARDAISSLEQYRIRHPSGALTEEARVLEIEALAKSGDRTHARELGTAFLNERPSSTLAPRVRRVVGAR